MMNNSSGFGKARGAPFRAGVWGFPLFTLNAIQPMYLRRRLPPSFFAINLWHLPERPFQFH